MHVFLRYQGIKNILFYKGCNYFYLCVKEKLVTKKVFSFSQSVPLYFNGNYISFVLAK